MPEPPEDLDDRGKLLWDRAYQLEHADVLWSEPPVPYVAGRAISLLRTDGARRVLDLPCGDGRNSVPLARAFPELVAADASPRALHILESRTRRCGLRNIETSREDVFRISFPDASFDGIVCWDLLGHLTRPRDALVELLRILRPGGRLVASTFALGDSTRGMEMRQIGPEEYIYDDRFYFKFRDEPETWQLVEDLPADVKEIVSASWMEPPHEGYRDYPHRHESWVMILQKEVGVSRDGR